MADTPDLGTLLRDHNSSGAAMGETTSAPHIDIPTTTAAVAAAQEAQLRNAVRQEEHQHQHQVQEHQQPQQSQHQPQHQQPQHHQEQHKPRPDSGLAMSVISVLDRTSPPLPSVHDLNQPSSSRQEASPSRELVEHELRLSPTAGDSNPPATICLCQQPARIPRPRNAFILFRQHNHASVVQANPGRPNPEISKIIGEMWRESSKETKLIWQKHADEEKRQHLARYPEYKYQPRRNGKKGTMALGAAGAPGMSESAVCSTCGGHTGALNTPDTPSTPMSATPLSAVSKSFRSTYMPTPKTPSGSFTQISPIPKTARRRKKDDASRSSGVEALLQLGIDPEEGELSPTASPSQSSHPSKKRRLTTASPTSTADVMDSLRTPHSSVPLMYGHDSSIDPFLRHAPTQHESSYGPVGAGSESPAGLGGEIEAGSPYSPALPAEDTLKTISTLQKLQAIAKICKPLPAPELIPGAAPRGAIIAIEGEDIAAVNALCESLADTLRGELVEIVNVADEIERDGQDGGASGSGDVVMRDYGQGTEEEEFWEEDGVKQARYLEALAAWRSRSNMMRRKVRATPQPPPSSSLQHHQQQQRSHSTLLPPISDVTQQHQPHSQSLLPPPPPPQTPPSRMLNIPEKLPIILLNRYILSRTNVASQKLFADGLTPIQHWQWVASLWKGCVGADMTILVKTDAGGYTGGGGPVEVKEPGKVIVVRKEGGRDWDGGSVRRLGFEVNECVRSLMGVNS